MARPAMYVQTLLLVLKIGSVGISSNESVAN